MSVSMKLHHLLYMAAAFLLLPLMCSCSSDDGSDTTINEESQIALSNHYINLNIVIGSGNEGTMRGTPEGKENGDGREAGFARENLVTGVTLILYKDAAGINTSAETTLTFINYYPVSLVSRETQGTSYSSDTKADEAIYTTGDQPLAGTGIDITETNYHAIIVANQNLASVFTTSSKVKEVRDYVMTHIYSGDGMKLDATHFVMSLETDYIVNFASPTSKVTNGNRTTYNFDNIRIERLAARMDFWAKNATYETKDKNNDDYTTPGYEYPVWKSTDTTTPTSADKFVLTAVTPFNLFQGTEYLFKRTNDASSPYLADETTTNYVLDPQWGNKTTAAVPAFVENALDDIITNNTVKMTTASFQTSKYTYTESTVSGDNMIVCYPKENTLSLTTPLYYYATGLAIEGDYYTDGEGTPEHLVFYGYLRHQGEDDGPYIIKLSDDLDKTQTGTVPMNFGVVRNNIYRISIEKINERQHMEINIKVKKWDPFTHEVIYM